MLWEGLPMLETVSMLISGYSGTSLSLQALQPLSLPVLPISAFHNRDSPF